MSDKKKLDNEIEQELEESFDGNQDYTEIEDYTVKVLREDYIVKRRFYDKDKALETADDLRQDVMNTVEDDIEHDFITVINEEDDVDWNKLVDAGLEFYPPISDAAGKKLESTSPIADELRDEIALVGKELDKTMVVGTRPKSESPKIEQPKIQQKDKIKEEVKNGISEEESIPVEDDEIDDDFGDIDSDLEDRTDEAAYLSDDLLNDLAGEVPGTKNKYGKSGNSLKKIVLLLFVVIIISGFFYYFNKPFKVYDRLEVIPQTNLPSDEIIPVPDNKTVEESSVVVSETPVAEINEKVVLPAPKKAEIDRVEIEPVIETIVEPVPVLPGSKIPPVTKNYPYTIHISSYQSQKKADFEVERITKRGFDAFSSFVQIPGKGNWYRLYSGYYEDYQTASVAATAMKVSLHEDLVIVKTVFGVQVGAVGEKKDLSRLKNQLQAKGYSVYYIPVATGSDYLRLMAGAFKKEAEASGLLNNLMKDGFDAEITKR